ncbi:MAG: hypothetical protein LBK06_03235 [Planctomycetaceae bacterium]|nr:hypothetical protein [Planctomycetaceae bacterium]
MSLGHGCKERGRLDRTLQAGHLRSFYAEAVLKFAKLNTAAQQRGAVVQGRSLPPYRLRYSKAQSKPVAILCTVENYSFCRKRF